MTNCKVQPETAMPGGPKGSAAEDKREKRCSQNPANYLPSWDSFPANHLRETASKTEEECKYLMPDVHHCRLLLIYLHKLSRGQFIGRYICNT